MNTDPFDPVRIGIVSVSDRASAGVYEDKGLPALKEWLGRALKNPITFAARLINKLWLSVPVAMAIADVM